MRILPLALVRSTGKHASRSNFVNTISAANPQCFLPHQEPGNGRDEATPGIAWKGILSTWDTHPPFSLAVDWDVFDASSCPKCF